MDYLTESIRRCPPGQPPHRNKVTPLCQMKMPHSCLSTDLKEAAVFHPNTFLTDIADKVLKA
jgi:hypothetical protein